VPLVVGVQDLVSSFDISEHVFSPVVFGWC